MYPEQHINMLEELKISYETIENHERFIEWLHKLMS